jgi:putative nucleotidyltransferase with HDIG domain
MSPAPVRIALDAFAPAVRDALRLIAGMAGREGGCWVVGGALRDALLGDAAGDLDVAVTAGALALGRALADRLGASFVALDEARGVARVVGAAQVDLADLRAADLEGDLRARDFTVNALAASIPALVAQGSAPVIDPCGGLADLQARVVRLCGPAAFGEDPVRALRAARLAAAPGWRLDPSAERLIAAAAPLVAGVSTERLRDELLAMLGSPRAGEGLRLLDRLAVLPVLLPESAAMRATPQPEPHRFDVWEHSLRAVEAVDRLLAELDHLAPWGPGLAAHLEQELGGGVRRAQVLRLAALLHDVAKPETRTVEGGRVRFLGHDAVGARRAAEIAARWRLPGRAAQALERLVAQHLRPMHLAQSGVTRRARYRFFRDMGGESRDLLLLALADAAALRGELPLEVWRGAGGAVLRDLMAGMAADERQAAARPLVTGEDVMAAFGLGPGPEVGRLLERAREAQALGLVQTREAALDYLRGGGAPPIDTPETGP